MTTTEKLSHDIKEESSRHRILWYNPPIFLRLRPDAMFGGFDECPYSNCVMTFIKSEATISDAVIFTGRLFPTKLGFSRPLGQIWIFYEHEPPYRYGELSNMWNQSNTFNWTMIYDKDIADIYLPYGKIKRKLKNRKSIDEIMQRKNGTALMIVSHCDTPSGRLEYIEQMKRHVDVEILGKCGKEWNCGRRFVHDDCFEIINNYKFYLAFENSLCSNYFTEKIYDNFDYDAILVSRGGKKGQIKQIMPDGTYVTADDFKNAKELGEYLKSMSTEKYRTLLEEKLKYTTLGSYDSVFHGAMCDLCEKMNKQDKFRKTIKNMEELLYSSTPCVPPDDIQ